MTAGELAAAGQASGAHVPPLCVVVTEARRLRGGSGMGQAGCSPALIVSDHTFAM